MYRLSSHYLWGLLPIVVGYVTILVGLGYCINMLGSILFIHFYSKESSSGVKIIK